MNSQEIREAFLGYFERNGHRRLPSSPLIPFGDPSLLFVNAGMVQFKDVFLGTDPRPYSRATTSQKCLRVSGKHNDLDTVGRTARHHTFFEMLGNFSFGDYFKQDAIRFAWELITGVYGIDSSGLWVTIYQDDEEAGRIWEQEIGVARDRIVALGEKDNFWSMGDTGPCGPCTEIHLDRGTPCPLPQPCSGLGTCDCDRFLEIYNLVFMQFDRAANGTQVPLPRPSVDTGMGLERLASVVQGVGSNWDTDLFVPLLEQVSALSGTAYSPGEGGFPHRVIADHGRAAAFLVADGVVPGNEGRGYVLRRIMRRAIRFGLKLGIERPFMDEVAGTVVGMMGDAYPELRERESFLRRAIRSEEERFRATLDAGLGILEEVLGQSEGTVRGEDVFRLYDTYGFPRELTEEVVAERGRTIDSGGFDRMMAEQRTRARDAARFRDQGRGSAALYEAWRTEPTAFLGYQGLHCDATVRAVVAGGSVQDVAREGDTVEVLLDRTVFYAEGGGQVGDTGVLVAPDGEVRVTDTQRVLGDLVVHYGEVIRGEIAPGNSVRATVDGERRLHIARHHTATHLLHAALRQVLGDHVRQAGSLVAPDRLRFDFSHLQAVTSDELAAVERLANQQTVSNLGVRTRVMGYDDAMRAGALAFFGDKYGDEVRVVSISGEARDVPAESFLRELPAAGTFSVELCGGTHVPSTGDVGLIRILGESSIGAGVRRIEAVSGEPAIAEVQGDLDVLATLSRELRTPPAQVVERVRSLLDDLAEERRKVGALVRARDAAAAGDLAGRARQAGSVTLIAEAVPNADGEALKTMANDLRKALGSGIVALASVRDGKPLFVVAVSQDLAGQPWNAGNLVRSMATRAGGGGGGRPDFAQAGGKDASAVDAALQGLIAEVEAGGTAV